MLFVAGAAVRQCDFEAGMLPQHLGILGDLYGKFARRGEYENSRLPLTALGKSGSGFVQQALKRGNQERRGLAGSGLRLPRNVPAMRARWAG